VHEGPALQAQQEAAAIFGAEKTYFVLNGTSSSNKIVLSALVAEGDLVLFDRNNHKAAHHGALFMGGGIPIFLETDRNAHGLIGPIYPEAFDEVRIRDKIRSGKFLIKSIHQRQQTISNIAHQIVKRQREFFEKGSSYLKPMTMVQIADAVGVHETTVSRAISGKYMATPQGVFDMKYFFTPGYQTSSGESMSNTSVKGAILDLVKNEGGNAPLSDKEIVEILSKRGIPIARRTVAKYRTELNILPSNMRRKY